MRPLKLTALCLVLITALLTAGCGEKETAESPTFFELRDNPSKTVFEEPQSAVYNRVNDGYTASLKTSDKYGVLVPFVGGYNTYTAADSGKTGTVKSAVWGLCNQNGEVVVDAVYDAVKKHMTDEGSFVYELIIGSDGSDPTAGERYLAAADGKWMFKIPKACVFRSLGAERVVFERTVKSGKNTYTYLDFYDFSGRRKFIFDVALTEAENTKFAVGSFSGGFAAVNVTVTDPKTKEKTQSAYYIDNTGKKIYKNFTYCHDYDKNGHAVVLDITGLYGVLDLKGEWVFKAEYDRISINPEKGYFVVAKDGIVTVLDSEKKAVKTVNSQKGYIEILNSEKLIYKKTNADTGKEEYFYLENDLPFACTETGMFPDSGESVDGLYVCTYGGTGTVFTEDGETVVALGDFGELVHRFGNSAVAVSENGRKTSIITVSSKQRTEWLKYTYTRENIADRYIVLYSYENGSYSLYDVLLQQFKFSDCEFISVGDFGTGKLLSVVTDGSAYVYDSELNVKLKTVSSTKH